MIKEHHVETIIEAPSINKWLRLEEIWQYRHLLIYLAGYAIQYRYRRTAIGWFWIIIKVLVPIVVFTLIFGELKQGKAHSNIANVPYFLYVMTGMALWSIVSRSLFDVTKSLRTLRKFSSTLAFPRILIPIATISSGLVEFATYFFLIIITNIFFIILQHKNYIEISFRSGLSLYLLLLTAIIICAIGFFTSVINTRFEDTKYLIQFFIQFWFYVTPAVYPISLIPEQWRWLIYLNPMAVIIECFRWSLLGVIVDTNILYILLIHSVLIFTLFVIGIFFFNTAKIEDVYQFDLMDEE